MSTEKTTSKAGLGKQIKGSSQAVGCSEASLKYLAPYVFKVAISGRPLE